MSSAATLTATASHASFDRAQTIERLEWIADLLDTALVIPGTDIRFGLDAIVGLVPGIGDAVTTAIALYLVHEARRLGLPRWKIARMLGNVAVDGLVGAIPVLGDVFDVAFKANKRNMRILRDHIAHEAGGRRR